MAIRPALLVVAGVLLAGCEGFGFGGAASAPPSPERVASFENMLQASGCELPQVDNDAMLAAGGFSDAEASAISQRLIAEGRATVAPNGNLVLQTGDCL
jgi:hypothetical protein